jgi:radical SAM superfamily enzyme YgiQ (UPF0313 family)/Tfp pilus assembly protein PilF
VDVLVLNPPFHPRFSRSQRSPAVIKSGVIYYPIWLAYATGVLEQDAQGGDHPYSVELIDAPAAGLSLADVLSIVDEQMPWLVVMDTSTPSIHNDADVAAAIKERVPGVFVLLVGPHVTALPEESLRLCPAADAVARGEYEYTVRDLARLLASGPRSSAARSLNLHTVQGLSFRDALGSVTHNAEQPPIEDLDALPLVSAVYKRHLQIRDYFYSIARYPQVTIVTGRGCPHHCSYCVWPQTLTGHRYRRRSVEDVAREFEYISRELPQVKEVFIEDDTLTVDRKRCEALAEALIQQRNRLAFSANSRADVPYETLARLKEAGLRLLCVGFESGDQGVLDAMRKGIKVEQFYQFREDARRAGVLVHGCFMAGGPGETRASLAKTLELAQDLNPDTAQFFPLMVYPGTDAYAWALGQGYLATDDFSEWLTDDGLHRTVLDQPGLTPADLAEWCDEARRSFYLRPGYIATKVVQVAKQPAEAGRILRATRVFARHLIRRRMRGGKGISKREGEKGVLWMDEDQTLDRYESNVPDPEDGLQDGLAAELRPSSVDHAATQVESPSADAEEVADTDGALQPSPDDSESEIPDRLTVLQSEVTELRALLETRTDSEPVTARVSGLGTIRYLLRLWPLALVLLLSTALGLAGIWLPRPFARAALGTPAQPVPAVTGSSPGLVGIMVELASLYQEAGRNEDAIRLLDEAVELGIEDSEVLVVAGKAYAVLGEQEKTVHVLEQAVLADPEQAGIRRSLAAAFVEIGYHQDAITQYELLLESDPDEWTYHLEIAKSYEALKDYDSAAAQYEQVSNKRPDSVRGPQALGNLYRFLERYDEALEQYERALERDPDYYWALLYSGFCYVGKQDYDRAIERYQAAINADPERANAYYYLGEMHLAQAELDDAREAYRKAIELAPEWAAAHIGVGKVYVNQGDCERAIPAFQEALNLAPKSQEAADGLAACQGG